MAAVLILAPMVAAAVLSSERTAGDGAGLDRGHGQTTVLMVLSPRMVYALREWPRMRQAAQDAGFRVLAARDPRVPLAEWAAGVRAAGQPDLAFAEAVDEHMAASLGALNHTPASLVARCGQWHSWPVLGVMPDVTWVSVLRAREAQLKETACP